MTPSAACWRRRSQNCRRQLQRACRVRLGTRGGLYCAVQRWWLRRSLLLAEICPAFWVPEGMEPRTLGCALTRLLSTRPLKPSSLQRSSLCICLTLSRCSPPLVCMLFCAMTIHACFDPFRPFSRAYWSVPRCRLASHHVSFEDPPHCFLICGYAVV